MKIHAEVGARSSYTRSLMKLWFPGKTAWWFLSAASACTAITSRLRIKQVNRHVADGYVNVLCGGDWMGWRAATRHMGLPCGRDMSRFPTPAPDAAGRAGLQWQRRVAKPSSRLERYQRTMECTCETRERQELVTGMMFAGRCSPNGN